MFAAFRSILYMAPHIVVDLDSSRSEAGVPLAVKAVVAVLVRSAVINTNKVIASGSMTARAPTAAPRHRK